MTDSSILGIVFFQQPTRLSQAKLVKATYTDFVLYFDRWTRFLDPQPQKSLRGHDVRPKRAQLLKKIYHSHGSLVSRNLVRRHFLSLALFCSKTEHRITF